MKFMENAFLADSQFEIYKNENKKIKIYCLLMGLKKNDSY